MDNYKISIVTVVKNNRSTIAQCMSSVQCQEGVEVEYIIIDGDSTDGTLDIIREKCWPAVTVVSEPDQGIYDAMNKGVARSTYDIVGILNADDFYADTSVLAKVTHAFMNSDVDCCYGDLEYVDAEHPERILRYWRSGYYLPSKFYWGWMPPHPTFFIKRKYYEKYGMFRLDIGTSADYEFMLRMLLKHSLRAAYIQEILVKMRVGGASNSSLTRRLMAQKMDRKAWVVNDMRPYPWTIIVKPIRKILQFFLRNK